MKPVSEKQIAEIRKRLALEVSEQLRAEAKRINKQAKDSGK
jgi:hypothetical protein